MLTENIQEPTERYMRLKDYDYYGSFSCWDTYRSQHPLLTLIGKGHVNDFIKSIVAKTKEYGWLAGPAFS